MSRHLVHVPPVNPHTDVRRFEDLVRSLEAFAPMIEAARSSPEQQRAIAELVDSLVAKQRKLTPDEELMVDGLVDAAGAAQLLGVSKSTIQSLRDGGELRFVRIAGCVRFPRRLLIQYAAQHLSTPRSTAGP